MTWYDKLAFAGIAVAAIGSLMFIIGFAAVVLHKPLHKPVTSRGHGVVIVHEYSLPHGVDPKDVAVIIDGGGGGGGAVWAI